MKPFLQYPKVLLSGVAVALFSLLATGVSAQTLSDYLKYAEQNNAALKASYAEYEAAMQRIAQAKGLPDPVFKASAFGQMVETRVGQQMMQLSIDQMFPWFGTLKAKGDVAAWEAEATLQMYYDQLNNLDYEVRRAYYPIYELGKTIALQERNIEILKTYKSLTLSRFQNGLGPMTDVIRTNIMIDNMNAEIEIMRIRNKALIAAFNKLLNRPLQEEVIMTDTLTITSWFPAKKDSVKNNPRLHSLDFMRKASEAKQRVAKKEGSPMIGIGFNYIVIDKRTDMDLPDNGKDAYMPMLTVTLPIYRKKYRAMTNEAKYMSMSYEEMKKDVSNELLSEYEATLFEMQQAQELNDLYSKQIEQTKQANDLLIAAMNNSNGNFDEILRLQQDILIYEVKQVQAVVAYKTAEAKLQYLTASHSKFNGQ